MFLLSILYLFTEISGIIIESDHIDINLPCFDKSPEASKLYNSITECSNLHKDNIFACSQNTGKIINRLLKSSNCFDPSFEFVLIHISYELDEEPLCFSNFLFSNYMSKLNKDYIKNIRLYPKHFEKYSNWKNEIHVLNQTCQSRSFISAKNFFEILNRLWPMIDMPQPALVLIEYFENNIINKGIVYNNNDTGYEKRGQKDYDDGGMNFEGMRNLIRDYDENGEDAVGKSEKNYGRKEGNEYYERQIKELKNEIGRNIRAIYELQTEVREILNEFRDFRKIFVMESEKDKDFYNNGNKNPNKQENQRHFTNNQQKESEDNILFDVFGIDKNLQKEIKDKILEENLANNQDDKAQNNFWDVLNELEKGVGKAHQDIETSSKKSQDQEQDFHKQTNQNDIENEDISDINIENWAEELEKNNNNTESEDYKSWEKNLEKIKMLIELIQNTNFFNCAIERILLKIPLNILRKFLPSPLLRKLKIFLNTKKTITNSECSDYQKMLIDMLIFLIESEQFSVYSIMINMASKGLENISPEQIIGMITFLYSNKELLKSADFSQWIYDASIFIKDLKNPLLKNAELYYYEFKKNVGPHLTNYAEGAKVKFDELKVQAGEKIEVLKEQAGVKIEVFKEKAGEKFDELKEQAGVKFDKLKEQAGIKFDEIKEQAGIKFDEFKGKAGEKYEELKGKAGEKLDELKEQAGVKIDELKEQAGIKMAEFKDKAGEKIDEIKEKAGGKIDEFKEKIEVKAGGYSEKAGEFLSEIKGKAQGYWSDLKFKLGNWYL